MQFRASARSETKYTLQFSDSTNPADCTLDYFTTVNTGPDFVYFIQIDNRDYDVEKSHSYLTDTDPVIQTMTSGTEWGTIEDDIWYVPKFYHLSKMRIFKDADTISGIEVKYVSTRTEGYEPLVHVFGRSTHHSKQGSITISNPITEPIRKMCIQIGEKDNGDREFSSISMSKSLDDTTCASMDMYVYPDTNQFAVTQQMYTFNNRLVGFHARIGADKEGNYKNIRSLAPILDSNDC